jgi:hypothetical protein
MFSKSSRHSERQGRQPVAQRDTLHRVRWLVPISLLVAVVASGGPTGIVAHAAGIGSVIAPARTCHTETSGVGLLRGMPASTAGAVVTICSGPTATNTTSAANLPPFPYIFIPVPSDNPYDWWRQNILDGTFVYGRPIETGGYGTHFNLEGYDTWGNESFNVHVYNLTDSDYWAVHMYESINNQYLDAYAPKSQWSQDEAADIFRLNTSDWVRPWNSSAADLIGDSDAVAADSAEIGMTAEDLDALFAAILLL